MIQGKNLSHLGITAPATLSIILGICLPTRVQDGDSSWSLIPDGGSYAVIPRWHIQSTAKTGIDLEKLSQPGLDVSSWYSIPASRCTLMGCLLETGEHHDTELFFSENLKDVPQEPFLVPWIYRNEFTLGGSKHGAARGNLHYFLETHGITSRGDIYLNGKEVASSDIQAGSYAGRTYDVTELVVVAEEEQPDDGGGGNNALVIQVHPTDYNYDFALGFVDWNPYPPDNGTGVWRNVVVRRTGAVQMGYIHVETEIELPAERVDSAAVKMKAVVENLEDGEIVITVRGVVHREGEGGYDGSSVTAEDEIELAAGESKEVLLTVIIDDPEIWWPARWGEQPLYTAEVSCSVGGDVSDARSRTFGLRTVTSKLNEHNDRVFEVNGHAFQVVGGGYSADIFLRWDSTRFETQVRYMLDLGLNTVRLEGKMEQPELYRITDRLGVMVMSGWECCDKWEAWSYNGELSVSPVPVWTDADYQIANMSLRHEASMMQSHPSVLAFLVGSDYWPDDRATAAYTEGFEAASWKIPIVSSASQRGFPRALGNSGMKMAGPYDWVPPNYWYDADEQVGSAFGFGSELGAGVGTPELGSLRKFLTEKEIDDIWKQPDEGLYHMSTSVSQFYDRKIYNRALRARFGTPETLDEYLLSAQMMDYEATRAEFEAYASRWNCSSRPATGLIYWMLNNAWPSLHWNLFDWYMHPAGSYYGAKMAAATTEHVVFDYVSRSVYLINRSLDRRGTRTVEIEVMGLDGSVMGSDSTTVDTEPNSSKVIKNDISKMLYGSKEVVLLRLVLLKNHNDGGGDAEVALSRNVYWLAPEHDVLAWEESTWFYTPVTKYANYSSLFRFACSSCPSSQILVEQAKVPGPPPSPPSAMLKVTNSDSMLPAVFVRLNLVDEEGEDVVPVYWSDNYLTLWPGESMDVKVSWSEGDWVRAVGGGEKVKVQVSGANLRDKFDVELVS